MDAPRTPQQGLDFLASRSPSTVVLGLDRMHEALEELGHPELRLRSVQVGGTNGKGSTCAFLDSVLRAAGHTVGMYTSPHLVRVNERIQVNGLPIDDETLGTRIVEVLLKSPAAMEATYFELGTLVALEHFARQNVEVVVLEVGLGGRLDATTAARPRLTALARVGMDHMEFLGDTLQAIAKEKAAILRKGVPAVVAEQRPEALSVIETCAGWVGAPLLVEGRDFSLDGLGRYRGPEVSLDGLALGLHGGHQHHNAAVAVTCAHVLERQGVAVGAEAIRTGLQRTRWPGRLEQVSGPQRGRGGGAGRGARRRPLRRAAGPPRLRRGIGQAGRGDAPDAPPPVRLGHPHSAADAAQPGPGQLRGARAVAVPRRGRRPLTGGGPGPGAGPGRTGRVGARCRVAVPRGRGEGAPRGHASTRVTAPGRMVLGAAQHRP
jgi:dihydrofolate synthase/folylpolyglutamate synthase